MSLRAMTAGARVLLGVMTTLMLAPTTVVVLATPETIGVEPDDVLAVNAILGKAIQQQTATPPVVGMVIDGSCLEDVGCRRDRLQPSGADLAVVLSIIRSGNTLDVRERLLAKDGGAILDARRAVTWAAFAASPLSPALAAALGPVTASATSTSTTTPTLTTPSPPPPSTATTASPALVPLLVTGAGAAVTVAGIVAFAVAATTVADAAASGDAKESAYVYGWAGIVAGVVGVGAAAAGAALVGGGSR